MAVNIINNSFGKKATVHVTGANATIVVAGNNSVSNIAIGTEEVVGAVINQIWYGAANGYWIVKRANSTTNTVVGVFDSTGYCDYAGVGSPIPIRQGDNLVLELVDSGVNGYIMVELRKVGNNNFNKN